MPDGHTGILVMITEWNGDYNPCLSVDIEIKGITLGQGHDTFLAYKEHLRKV